MQHIYTHLESTKFLHNISKPSFIYDPTRPWWERIHDPNGEFVTKWNRIVLATSLTALFVDPLFLYLPKFRETCIEIDVALGASLIFLRTCVDVFSILQILMKFRTAYVAPSSRVFGRGELVLDPWMIAFRYIKNDFAIDLTAALPLPQILVMFKMPLGGTSAAARANHAITLVIILQYIPRLAIIFPLHSKIIKNTGVVAKTAWSGAAFNLSLYILLSHVLGAVWYLMAFERQFSCWKSKCAEEIEGICEVTYLDCRFNTNADAIAWKESTETFSFCTPKNFTFGMFAPAYDDQVNSAGFLDRCFYCLWWGLRQLVSYGQGLQASTQVVETIFSSLICLVGLVFFALLIGNMQTYLQSLTARLEEWRIKRRDTEEWMRHRQLPPDLQERVRRFVQYKWIATRGVDEEEILESLPLDIRRQIRRHLCLNLVRRVPFFSQMDDPLLDAICERVVSSLNTKDMYIIREGDPVNEMFFIIRGELESSTTNGGRSGFFNSITLKQGDFCGEELLTWALMPNPQDNLPLSTRTVKSLTEVEAFALRAEDLKFVSSQFRHLHSKKLQHAFRYYSHQWRTWGACFIQAAWRRHKRRKLAEQLARQGDFYYSQDDADIDEARDSTGATDNAAQQHLSATLLASKFAANTRKGANQKIPIDDSSLRMPKLFKPSDPDFSSSYKESKDTDELIEFD